MSVNPRPVPQEETKARRSGDAGIVMGSNARSGESVPVRPRIVGVLFALSPEKTKVGRDLTSLPAIAASAFMVFDLRPPLAAGAGSLGVPESKGKGET